MKNFKTLFTLTLLLYSFTLSAQGVGLAELNLMPNFLITILAGVLLSFGFQFLLTALSVALGVTSTSNLKEEWVENKYSIDDDDDDDNNKDDRSSNISMGVKITAALGVWNILTVAPSLFAGTFLALMLTPIDSLIVNIALALVIWAAFFMLLFYLESRMLGTLIGGLINAAVAGLKSTGSAIQSIVTPSPQNQIQNVANNTIEKFRQEMTSTFDTDSIVSTLNKYVKQLSNNVPEYSTLKNDLKEIAALSSSSNSSKSNSPAKWTAIQTTIQSVLNADENKFTQKGKDKAKQLNDLLAEMKAAYSGSDSTKEGVQNVLAASPVDEEKVNNYFTKIQNFFQKATPDNMEWDTMKKELNTILDDPSKAVSGLREKINELDRAAVIELLEKNTSLDKAQINSYAEQAESLLKQAKEKLNLNNTDLSFDKLLKRFENNVANFINSTDDSRLDYTLLKNDFSRAINNPAESLKIVKNRLNTFDRDTLTSIITNTRLIDRADINDVVQSVEDARNEVIEQVKNIESTARSSMKNMERKAVIKAEHVRKSAISAAWWLVATIVIAAAAAVAGALVAV